MLGPGAWENVSRETGRQCGGCYIQSNCHVQYRNGKFISFGRLSILSGPPPEGLKARNAVLSGNPEDLSQVIKKLNKYWK